MTIDPIGLFNHLDKSHSSIKELRLAQKEVLEWYVKNQEQASRLGIRLPTGAGKSLIALLILESWRLEGKPVAILTASTGLAQDIATKAKELEIPAVTIFGSEGDANYRQERTRNLTKYRSHRAIGIFNYHSYLYSTQYRQETIPAKVMVIDDANEFEGVRNDFFTLRIERDQSKLKEQVYMAIVESLRPHFQVYPNLPSFLDKTSKPGAVEVIHFTHLKQVLDTIKTHMYALGADATFSLSYERNKDKFDSFITFITEDEIEIRPLVVPEDTLKLADVEQIIFVGATLYPKELLQKCFGIRKSNVKLITDDELSAEAKEQMDKFGKRLILPIDITQLVSSPHSLPLDTIASLVGMHGKMLVLANSKRVARTIENYLRDRGITTIYYLDNYDAEKFKSLSNGALICANRYIGLDFPGDTAKVCSIVTLPIYLEPLDNFQNQVLFNTRLINRKVANRLVQAFGRCNRLETDEAIYYVLDPRILSRFTGEEQYFEMLPRRIYAELNTGLYLSENGTPAAAFDYAKNKFFGMNDPQFEKFMTEEKAEWMPAVTSVDEPGFQQEIEAWEKSLQSSYETAAEIFEKLAKDSESSAPLISAWNYYLAALNYYDAHTAYQAKGADKKCQEALRKAIDLGGKSSWFNRLREIFNELAKDSASMMTVDVSSIEARRIKEQIVSDYEDFVNSNTSRKKTWQAVFGDYRKDLREGTHSQVLVVLEEMLGMMGYSTRRGDNNKGEPDLIATSSHTIDKYRLSIEVKTKQQGEMESKESVGQTLSDAMVLKKKSQDYQTIPVLITQKEKFSEDALRVAIKEVTLFRAQEFDYLLDKLYSQIESWSTLTSTHQQQAFIDSVISPHELFGLFRPSEEPVVTLERINSALTGAS